MNQSTHIDPGIGEDAIRCTELFMDGGEGLLHLAFVTDVTDNADRCARTLSPRSLRGLRALSPFLSRTATLSPRLAQSRAVARPIPPPPPVMTMSRDDVIPANHAAADKQYNRSRPSSPGRPYPIPP